MANEIVQINVTQTVAPQPPTLQQTGAFVSQGGTTLAAGTKQLLTSPTDLNAILVTAKNITSITWSAQVATVTTAIAHGLTNAETVSLTIAGATPSGYNGTFPCTVTGANTFTYPLASNPGMETVPGTWIPASVLELTNMNTEFYAQGSQQSVYVLEFGPHPVDSGVAALTTWIAANLKTIYAFLVPLAWGDSTAFQTLVNLYTAPTAMTYFFTTLTLGNYAGFVTLAAKSVFSMVEAPAVPANEVSLASYFWDWLHFVPSSTNKLTPSAFTFLFSVTAYPTPGNGATLAALKAGFVNYVGTGAEGGISNTILFWGTTMDGQDASYWYSVDWVQLNSDQKLAAAVINGSNDHTNPLYYNQQGIDRLQTTEAGVMTTAISSGMAFGSLKLTTMATTDFVTAFENGDFEGFCVVNADPFVSYVKNNPDDYTVAKYGGLTIVYTPNKGFKQIIVGLNVVNFQPQQ